jgi:hypothetical protein
MGKKGQLLRATAADDFASYGKNLATHRAEHDG